MLFGCRRELFGMAQWSVNSEVLHYAPETTQYGIDMCINCFPDLNFRSVARNIKSVVKSKNAIIYRMNMLTYKLLSIQKWLDKISYLSNSLTSLLQHTLSCSFSVPEDSTVLLLFNDHSMLHVCWAQHKTRLSSMSFYKHNSIFEMLLRRCVYSFT